MAIIENISDTAQAISNVGKTISNFFDSIVDIISTIISIVKALRYGFTSLVSGFFDLFEQLLDRDVFINTAKAFGEISQYIGGPATVFIASLLIIIMLRIFYGFVMSLIKGNDKYELRKTNRAKGREQSWEKHVSESIDEFENGRRIFHG